MSRPDEPSVSLIVCTKNRAAQLARCLQAISAIESPEHLRFEVVLVDNGSTDDTRTLYERWRGVARFPMRYLFEPTPGIGNAMNCGYRESSGSIVAFTDDDCYPAADFPQAVAATFSDPRVGVVAGRILLHDPTDLPITIDESLTPRRYRAGTYIRPGQFHGANLCFRRTALDAIGGFDPLFGPGSYIGSAADCDAVARVCLAGWDGLYEPSIVVQHHHGRKLVHQQALRKRYAIGSGGYHMKLLVQERQVLHFLRYACGAAKRAMREPSIVFWEAVGATRYLGRSVRSRQTMPNAIDGAARTADVALSPKFDRVGKRVFAETESLLGGGMKHAVGERKRRSG